VRALPPAIAIAAAIGLAATGVMRGTYAAGGSDSSCYALMAEAFASGHLQPTSTLVAQAPWPDAPATFSPGGFVPSRNNASAAAPVCAPGFSVLLSVAVMLGGLDALFWVTPLAAVLLVGMTYLAARELCSSRGPLAGAMAAVLIAFSPPVLYQVVQPMNDITTAALWMAVFVSLLHRRWTLAGACCGLALLVRPNLLPLAAVAGLFVCVAEPIPAFKLLIARIARFGFAALPFALLVLWLNNALYGSPLATGYGHPGNLFGLSLAPNNASRYLGWLLETHTAFPLVALAAPFVVARQRLIDILLALGLIGGTCFIYLIYTPFDDWSYLRFLLPAIALMLALASVTTVQLLDKVFARARYAKGEAALHLSTLAITLGLAAFCLRAADERHAFALRFLEQRYRSAGIVVRDRLPPGAVVLSAWDSGAVRFHGGKEVLTWGGLDPAWLDRSLSWLDERGRKAYIMVESWEEPAFRSRFGDRSDIGKLDWPPTYEVDRVVRIFDPHDRARYHRGEHVNTEYLWPLKR